MNLYDTYCLFPVFFCLFSQCILVVVSICTIFLCEINVGLEKTMFILSL